MPRLDRIYTKTGDEGMTGLGGGQRVAKDSLRVEAYGTVDELNSHIGVALAIGLCERMAAELPAIQNQLFDLGADLATPATSQARHPVPTVQQRHIEALESLIDELNEVVGPLTNFLLPGGSPGAAQLHVARTVCRRAERKATTLAREEAIGPTVRATPSCELSSSTVPYALTRAESFGTRWPPPRPVSPSSPVFV